MKRKKSRRRRRIRREDQVPKVPAEGSNGYRGNSVMDVVEHKPVTDLFKVSLEFFVSDR